MVHSVNVRSRYCFQFLVVRNTAAVNMAEQVLPIGCCGLGHMPRRGRVGPYDRFIFTACFRTVTSNFATCPERMTVSDT